MEVKRPRIEQNPDQDRRTLQENEVDRAGKPPDRVRNAVQEQFPKDIEEMGRRIKIDPKLIAPKAPEVESEEEREQEER